MGKRRSSCFRCGKFKTEGLRIIPLEAKLEARMLFGNVAERDSEYWCFACRRAFYRKKTQLVTPPTIRKPWSALKTNSKRKAASNEAELLQLWFKQRPRFSDRSAQIACYDGSEKVVEYSFKSVNGPIVTHLSTATYSNGAGNKRSNTAAKWQDEAVRGVVSCLDTGNVSLKTWNELSQLVDGPSERLVRSVREHMNREIEDYVTSISSDNGACWLDQPEEVLRVVLTAMVRLGVLDKTQEIVHLKISGDGAQMTRSKTHTFFTFHVIGQGYTHEVCSIPCVHASSEIQLIVSRNSRSYSVMHR